MELVPDPPTGWTLDKRVAIAGALGLVALGLIIGFRIRGGVPDVIEVPAMAPPAPAPAPCADCAEREIKASRPIWPTVITNGDSSVPDD